MLVLALPRGGVPVAAEVAGNCTCHSTCLLFANSVCLVTQSWPWARSLLAACGIQWRRRNSLQNPGEVIDAVSAEELTELQRREQAYRDDLPPPEVEGKTVILVDDGIATGSTMLAAVSALRQLNAARIVVAAPVIAGSTYYEIRRAADDVGL